MRTPIKITPLVVCVCFFWGCPGPEATPDAGLGLAEIGTGTLAYEALVENQDLDLIFGIQGGYHFVTHARMQKLLPGDPEQPGALGNPRTTFSVFTEAGEQIDAILPPYRLGYVEGAGGFWELPSGRITALSEASEALVPDIYGQRVRIAVEIIDASEATATAETWVTVREGPVS